MSKKMAKKHLKDQCYIGDEDEVQEITGAETPMKKKKPVCVTCNQTFAKKKWVEKNTSRKSTISSKNLLGQNVQKRRRK